MKRSEQIKMLRVTLEEMEWPSVTEDAEWRLWVSKRLSAVALDLVKDDAPKELRQEFRERIRAARGGSIMPQPGPWDTKLPADRCRSG